MYHGDIRLGDTIDVKFTSRTFSTGAPGTLSSSPVISAYPSNSTTELTAGITLSVDFDSRTGLNHVRVVATSGNGYATATNYTLVITTGTVGGVSVVGECVGSFSIEARSALMPATAARTLVVDAAGLADANAVKIGPTGSGTAQTARDLGASVLLSTGTGAGQLDFTSGVVKANLAQILGTALTETAGLIAAGFKKFFNIATPAATMDHLILVDTVTTYTGNTPQTGDNYARLGAPAGASVSADIAAAKTDTAAIKTKTDFLPSATAGAAGGVFIAGSNAATTVNITGNVSGSVGSVTGAVGSVTGAVGSVTGLTAADVGAIKAKTDNLPAAPAAVSDIPSAASIASTVWASTIEGSNTALKMMRGFAAAMLGKASGLATATAVYRDTGDSKDRITATVDTNGNRTAVTLDLT